MTTTTYIITVRGDEELLEFIKDGLMDGSVVAVHKVHPDDVAGIRTDLKLR